MTAGSASSGPLKAVILDWAGTVVDHGCMGPAAVFVQAFAERGVAVPMAVARKFMGLRKIDHLRAMLAEPGVADAWIAAHGAAPSEADVASLYGLTESLMVAAIAAHSDPIPGALEAVAAFRAMGLKIGSSTGYTAPMMDVLTREAAAKGYAPDAVVCSSDVPQGRPAPFMCYKAALALEVFPLSAMVKIGDTVADVGEGLNAGMWVIGLTACGNEVGLTHAELAALSPAERAIREAEAADRLKRAGAHYTAPDLPSAVAMVREIAERATRGETPSCPA